MRKLVFLLGVVFISTVAYAAGNMGHSGHMGSMMKEEPMGAMMKDEDMGAMMNEEGMTMPEAASPEDAGSKAVVVGNKICPVTGEEIGTMGAGVTYEYQGKIYNLCCPGCVAAFKKDPEKYIKIIEENMEADTDKAAVKSEDAQQTHHQDMLGGQEKQMMTPDQDEEKSSDK